MITPARIAVVIREHRYHPYSRTCLCGRDNLDPETVIDHVAAAIAAELTGEPVAVPALPSYDRRPLF